MNIDKTPAPEATPSEQGIEHPVEHQAPEPGAPVSVSEAGPFAVDHAGNVDESAPIRAAAATTAPAMIREWEHREAGFAGSGWFSRVRALQAGERRPPHSEDVPIDTPEQDWKRGNP